MAKGTFGDIIADIRKKQPAPVYILMGEEDYYIDRIMESLEKNVIEEEDKDFNFNMYYGVDADMDVIVTSCQQLPVMGNRRLVLLKEAQSIRNGKQVLEKLAQYVKNPNPSTVFALAFKGDKLNATSELLKATKNSTAVVFNSEKVRDYQLSSHVKDFCNAHKCNIDQKSIDLLCQYVGGPLSKLFGEITKLMTINGTNAAITPEEIEKHIGISKDFNNFELTSAVGRKDYPKAVQIIKYFKANPKTNPSVMTTSALFNFFTRLVTAHYMPDKSDQALEQQFNLRGQKPKAEFRQALTNYNPYRAVNAIHAIREFDVKSKGVGSMQNEYDLLLELIFKLFSL